MGRADEAVESAQSVTLHRVVDTAREKSTRRLSTYEGCRARAGSAQRREHDSCDVCNRCRAEHGTGPEEAAKPTHMCFFLDILSDSTKMEAASCIEQLNHRNTNVI